MADILADIGFFILLVNTILYIKGFSRQGRAFRIFTIYMSLMFIIELIMNILNYEAIHNLFLSHFYFIFQLIVLSVFYYKLLTQKAQRQFVVISVIVCLAVLGIEYYREPQLFFKFNLFEIFITSFLVVIYAVLHFYNLLTIERRFYYINMGIMIYLFGSTVLFLSGNLVATLISPNNHFTWMLNSVLYILYQLFILYEWKVNFASKNNKSKNNEAYS